MREKYTYTQTIQLSSRLHSFKRCWALLPSDHFSLCKNKEDIAPCRAGFEAQFRIHWEKSAWICSGLSIEDEIKHCHPPMILWVKAVMLMKVIIMSLPHIPGKMFSILPMISLNSHKNLPSLSKYDYLEMTYPSYTAITLN